MPTYNIGLNSWVYIFSKLCLSSRGISHNPGGVCHIMTSRCWWYSIALASPFIFICIVAPPLHSVQCWRNTQSRLGSFESLWALGSLEPPDSPQLGKRTTTTRHLKLRGVKSWDLCFGACHFCSFETVARVELFHVGVCQPFRALFFYTKCLARLFR